MGSWAAIADHNIFGEEEEGGLSVRPVIGYNFGEEGEFATNGGDAASFDLEGSLVLGLDVVYEIDSNWRVEGNLRYGQSEVEGVSYNRAMISGQKASSEVLDAMNSDITSSGEVGQLSLGGSVWYSVDVGFDDFTPYIGGGLNYTFMTLDSVKTVEDGYVKSEYNDGAGSFGISLGMGVDYAISDNMDLSLVYHYRHLLGEYEFKGREYQEDSTLTIDELAGHSIMAGVNVNF